MCIYQITAKNIWGKIAQMKREIDRSIIIIVDFNVPLEIINR